ncbi:unnamed protein product [Rotaria socialis]|uniref:Uncharacterized protein n=1 Tax=Rotaria socialis TaxID=392032 RepID=A0A820E7H3_9BILA|nr:unnamed protein product [Rotaria socialis]CAF3201474.1 unnamed protein product [Rotaria socialis]CAF3374150.1 unnamed protein product [Rotaria socialis]CAF3523611.1 unnamed protein product [Rotaria socialis]CAF4111256.1 unnamed protein product [Rotaria socialis]
MPKSRKKNGTSKNVTSSGEPIPLLDSIRTQIQAPDELNHDIESARDNDKVSTAGWQCDIKDWSGQKASNYELDAFPQTIRSLERKHEQSKNILFRMTNITTAVNENKLETKQEINDQMKMKLCKNIDILKLTAVVTDLITGQRDESAYKDFLSILQIFSVNELRDDHLEETIYHLIQAAVSFIRSNEARFDSTKLQECYRQRCIMKMNALK